MEKTRQPVTKSVRLVHLKEFLINKQLRPEEIAGFKTYIGDTRFMSSENWDAAFAAYQTRKIY